MHGGRRAIQYISVVALFSERDGEAHPAREAQQRAARGARVEQQMAPRRAPGHVAARA